MRNVLVLMLLCLFGCEQTNPDIIKVITKVERFADFTHFTSTTWKHPGGGIYREKKGVKVAIVPAKAGAYLIMAPEQFDTLKIIVSENEALESPKYSTTQPTITKGRTIEWWGDISQFTVIFSDGNCIEATVVKTDP